MRENLSSWGGLSHRSYPVKTPTSSKDCEIDFAATDHSFLAYGLGRSYGDVCLNSSGTLVKTIGLDRFINYDRKLGRIKCQSGVTFASCLQLIVADHWFLPVTPGTKFITLGGAVANDVHGKNHHTAGTFGNHIIEFELMRSDGSRHICSPSKNPDLFAATIGGLGLTGLITWVEFQLIKGSAWIDSIAHKFHNLREFFALSQEMDAAHDYSVAWLDCISKGNNLGRGIYTAGNHAQTEIQADPPTQKPKLWVPFNFPSLALNSLSMQGFNLAYFHTSKTRKRTQQGHYDPFFYPLDFISGWNKIYGKRGFYQYQVVIPIAEKAQLEEILKVIAASGMASFLAVLKVFGPIKAPGMLSFPKQGYTLALDFPNYGNRIISLFNRLDQLTIEAGGRIYPAKDARMPARVFQKTYSRWQEFNHFTDPRFTSDFWKRVTDDA